MMFDWLSDDQLKKHKEKLLQKARNAPRNLPNSPSNAFARFSQEYANAAAELKNRETN